MKAAILTLYYNNNNYGGIAQAFALQKHIELKGIEAEVLTYKRTSPPMFVPADRNIFAKIKRKAKKLPYKLSELIEKYCVNRTIDDTIIDGLKKRELAFERSRDMIPHSKLFTDESIADAEALYDIFISGSDQIWKPGTVREAFLLDFVKCGKKKISYASSITMTGMSEDYGRFMKKHLESYNAVSVRERSAAEYLESLTGRHVETVLDPALILDRKIWEELAGERMISVPYAFVYLLGDDKKQRKHIRKIADEYGIRIVFMPHTEGIIRACDIDFGDIEIYDADIGGFLSLIKNAEMIFTDSFHAAVFSNIFHRNFWLYERSIRDRRFNMNSRIEALLKLADEQERFIDTAVSVGSIVNSRSIDFEHTDELLAKERERSVKWLDNALGI